MPKKKKQSKHPSKHQKVSSNKGSGPTPEGHYKETTTSPAAGHKQPAKRAPPRPKCIRDLEIHKRDYSTEELLRANLEPGQADHYISGWKKDNAVKALRDLDSKVTKKAPTDSKALEVQETSRTDAYPSTVDLAPLYGPQALFTPRDEHNSTPPKHPIYSLREIGMKFDCWGALGVQSKHFPQDETHLLTHVVVPNQSYIDALKDLEDKYLAGGHDEHSLKVTVLDAWPWHVVRSERLEWHGPTMEMVASLPAYLFGHFTKVSPEASDEKEKRRQIRLEVKSKLRSEGLHVQGERMRKGENEGKGKGKAIILKIFEERRMWKRRHSFPVFQQLEGDQAAYAEFQGWWRAKKARYYVSGVPFRTFAGRKGQGSGGKPEIGGRDDREADDEMKENRVTEEAGPHKAGSTPSPKDSEIPPAPYWQNFHIATPAEPGENRGYIMVTFEEIDQEQKRALGLGDDVARVHEEVKAAQGKGFKDQSWECEAWSCEEETLEGKAVKEKSERDEKQREEQTSKGRIGSEKRSQQAMASEVVGVELPATPFGERATAEATPEGEVVVHATRGSPVNMSNEDSGFDEPISTDE